MELHRSGFKGLCNLYKKYYADSETQISMLSHLSLECNLISNMNKQLLEVIFIIVILIHIYITVYII